VGKSRSSFPGRRAGSRRLPSNCRKRARLQLKDRRHAVPELRPAQLGLELALETERRARDDADHRELIGSTGRVADETPTKLMRTIAATVTTKIRKPTTGFAAGTLRQRRYARSCVASEEERRRGATGVLEKGHGGDRWEGDGW